MKLAALLALPALLATSGEPRAAHLDWGSIDVLMMPDSVSGTLVWVHSHQQSKNRAEGFATYFPPAMAEAWAKEARSFLDQPLTESDTGAVRLSASLADAHGDELYLIRRRRNGQWSGERIIAMQKESAKDPWLIIGIDRNVRQFVDSLELVAARTVMSERAAQLDTIDYSEHADTTASPSVIKNKSPAPRYPVAERANGVEGEVFASFVVRTDSTADVGTVQILFATTPGFESAVRTGIPKIHFRPAKRDGAPVVARVFMPFQFSLLR